MRPGLEYTTHQGVVACFHSSLLSLCILAAYLRYHKPSLIFPHCSYPVAVASGFLCSLCSLCLSGVNMPHVNYTHTLTLTAYPPSSIISVRTLASLTLSSSLLTASFHNDCLFIHAVFPLPMPSISLCLFSSGDCTMGVLVSF